MRVEGQRTRLVGTLLVLLSAFAWSLNGLYTRALTVDVWTTLVGRAICTTLMLAVALLVIHRGGTVRYVAHQARYGFLAFLFGLVTMICFVTAFFTTSVANVTVIYAASPLIAAVLARIVLGDALVPRTIIALVVALAGVAVTVAGSLGTGRLLGDMLALGMSACFAVLMVEMRRRPDIDNLVLTFLNALAAALLLWPLADLSRVTATDALVLFLFGFTSNVLGFFAIVAAVRRLPPAEAGLYATVEILLAPLWVWLAFGENPGLATMAGGAIVLLAVVWHLSADVFGPRRSKMAVQASEAAE